MSCALKKKRDRRKARIKKMWIIQEWISDDSKKSISHKVSKEKIKVTLCDDFFGTKMEGKV